MLKAVTVLIVLRWEEIGEYQNSFVVAAIVNRLVLHHAQYSNVNNIKIHKL